MSTDIVAVFKEVFGKAPVAAARAPGRLEVLGNHTDYNEGLVLSAAVGQSTEVALAPSDGDQCIIHNTMDGSQSEFALSEIDKKVPGEWTNYIKGLLVELRKRKKNFGAFKAALTSTVPLSAGMSSSAALEISMGFALSSAFGIEMPPEEWARAGQGVENNYLGVKTGLLDQFSSIFGKEDSLILCDFRTVKVLKNVPLPHGYCLVVANTMVKHNLVDSDYNRRRESCERALAGLKKKFTAIKALRDVTPEMLEEGKGLLEQLDYLRAAHVVGENDRVLKGVAALENGDIAAFGRLLFASHQSSRENFENSCPELDCLVELASSLPGCAGARLSGGGFGGISIHLVENAKAQEYCERLKTSYKLQTGRQTETIICSIGAGANVRSLA
ncbi:MAG: galactokinase [Lentisphaerae bacterium GWF2_52_8]|nr:MAG: galactokinase [Lentisphaerae bacterium GWF2_52_8]